MEFRAINDYGHPKVTMIVKIAAPVYRLDETNECVMA
jgi:hypothetical protein